MAESSIQITQGSGTSIDVVAPGAGSTYRQLVSVGDPNSTLAAGIANVSNGALSVGATLYGTSAVSFASGATVTAIQGTNPWLTNASIVGTLGVNASIQGTVPISGNVGFTANTTLTAYQGGAPWLANASIIGTVPVSQSGSPWSDNITQINGATLALGQTTMAKSVPVAIASDDIVSANVSIQGTVPVSGFPTSINVSLLAPVLVTLAGNVSIGAITVNSNSSITAFQGGAPWLTNASIVGTLGVNASIQGTVPVSGTFYQTTQPISGNVGLIASTTLTAYQGNAPWLVNASIQGQVPVTASIAGIVTVAGSFSANLAAGSTVAAQQLGAPWSVVQGTGSTMTVYQGTNPWGVGSATGSGVPGSAVPLGVNSGGNLSGLTSAASTSDSTTGTAVIPSTDMNYNGSTWNYNRAAGTANGTTGTGLLGSGILGYDGTNWRAAAISTLGSVAVNATTVFAQMANASASWTNANATNSTLALTGLSGYGTLFASFTGSSITGGTLNFEAYDGTTWWPFPMMRNNSYQTDTSYTLNGAATQYWQGDLSGFQQARIRLNPAITGASLGTANIQLVANAAPNMTNMVVGQPTASNLQTTTTLTGGVAQFGTWGVNVSLLAPAMVTLSGPVTLGSVNLSPTTGGWTNYAASGLASQVTISNTAGKFGGYMFVNLNSAPAYLQIFDVAGASNVTLGLNVPNIVIPFPANATAANGMAANLELTNGAILNNGLKAAVTTGANNASIVATGLAGTLWYH